MKNKSIISILLFALGLSFSFSSCEDMLTVDSDRNVYQTGQDTLYSYWGIMKSMQNLAERYVILGESRGDLISPSAYAIDSINDIATFKNPADKSCRYLNVKDYYSVINNCNCYLAWADTSLIVLGNQKMMIKEYAQVLAIRAWTYMQLVNTYGTVPFYTEPLTSLAFVDNFDFSQASNQISHTNIADKLAGELIKLADVDYPSYGNYETGSTTIASKLCFLPLRAVIGDLYLMENKPEQAAWYYYEYLKKNKYTLPTNYHSTAGISTMTMNGYTTTEYVYTPGGSIMFCQTEGTTTTNEAITVIPGAANPQYGQMLPGICELYGYQVSTSVSSDSGNNDDATGEQTTSISLTTNPKKQLEPSEGFMSIANSNFYYSYDEENTAASEYIPGDARQGYISERSGGNDIGRVRYITKPAPYGFSYTFPVIYRKALIWLRFAEAINRAKFPSYAYAILKDGLCDYYIPDAPYMETVELTDPDTGDVLTDPETGEPLTEEVERYNPLNNICYYITQSDRKRAVSTPYLDFSSDDFVIGSATDPDNIGVHRRGGGKMEGRLNGLYDYDLQLGFKFKEMGITPTSLEDTIRAVEELIVDELALETCFEGNRLPDLIRIARNKNEAGEQGNEWLADKIALRTFKLDTELCNKALVEAEGNATTEELTEDPILGEKAYIEEAIKQKNDFRNSDGEYMRMKSLLRDDKQWFLPLPSYK